MGRFVCGRWVGLRSVGVLTVAAAYVGGLVAGLLIPELVERAPAGRRPLIALPRRIVGTGAVLVFTVAAVWAVLAAVLGRSADLPAFLYLGWVGVALAAIDIRHHRLPDVLVLPSYPIALLLLGCAALANSDKDAIARAVVGALLLAAFYYLLALGSPGGLGLGDVKLAGALGLYLGWTGWVEIVLGTLLAFLAAAVLAVALMASGRATRASRLPFGPFMILGALASIALAG